MWLNLDSEDEYIITDTLSVKTVHLTRLRIFSCNCDKYIQTEKNCKHTYTVTLFQHLDPFVDYIKWLQ